MNYKDDDIEEDIVEEIIDDSNLNIMHNRDDVEGIGASASLGID